VTLPSKNSNLYDHIFHQRYRKTYDFLAAIPRYARRPTVRASRGKKKREVKEGTQSHKKCILAICGAESPGPILVKIGVLVAPYDLLKVKIANSVIKFLRVSYL